MHCLRSFVFSSLLAVLAVTPAAVVVDALSGAGSDGPVPVGAHHNHRMAYKYSRSFSSTADSPSTMTDKVERRVDDIEKSVGDSRVYRGLVLKNGLTALLISDPDTDKSAASLSVAVGE